MQNAKPWMIATAVMGFFLVMVLSILVSAEISRARDHAEAKELMEKVSKGFGGDALSPEQVRKENRELMRQFPSAGYTEDMTIEERNRRMAAYAEAETKREMGLTNQATGLPGQDSQAPGQTP
jgi:hypothetical protein